MTGQDMVYNFQRLVETISPVFLAPEKLDTWEMLDWLTRTQERFIRLKYLNNNSFEQNVYRLSMVSDDLARLLKTESVSLPYTQLGNIEYSKEIPLPEDFLAYVRSDSIVSRTLPKVVTNRRIGNVEINYDKIDSVITTHQNHPILEAPIVTMKDNTTLPGEERVSILLIHDKYTTLKGFYITYIKKPEAIKLDKECELAPYMHEDLVKLAVSMYIEEYKLKLAGGKQNA